MKIIYIVNARIPTEKAHGVQIMKMCEAFVLRGIDLELVVPFRRGKGKIDPFSQYGISKKFTIKYLPTIDFYASGRLGFIVGSFFFALNSFFYGLYCKLFKRGVIFYSRDQDQFSFFPFFFLLRPYFFEVHGLKKNGFLHKKLFKNISGVIATNSFIKNKLEEYFPNLKGKTITLPNGFDPESFCKLSKKDARQKLSLPEDKKIVVYVGHFYEWKGISTFLEASKLLPEDFLVCLVGGTPEDEKRLKTSFGGLNDKVFFAGYRPHLEIPLWYSASDVLVITGNIKDVNSVSYTSPLKLFEYIGSGRPVVAIDSPAIKDIVSTDEVYFYKGGDKESLKNSIISAISNKEESSKKVDLALKKSRGFSWKERVGKIEAFIKNHLE